LIEGSTFFLVNGIIFLIGLRLYIVMAAFRGVINFTFLFFVELFLWKNSYICKHEYRIRFGRVKSEIWFPFAFALTFRYIWTKIY